MTAAAITRHPNKRGDTVGVMRDGQPVGYATRVSRARQPEQWTAFIYTVAAPYDWVRPGFDSLDTVAEFIAAHGTTPDHLRRA